MALFCQRRWDLLEFLVFSAQWRKDGSVVFTQGWVLLCPTFSIAFSLAWDYRFVTDFITNHQDLFQIGGSIVLIVFALFMILRSPVKGLKHDDEIKVNYTHDAITGFAFTLSNPLIIFLIFPLFARFGFPSSEYQFYHYIIGYVFIVVGALLWWTVITYLVDKFRAKFNINSMWLINKIMGGII